MMSVLCQTRGLPHHTLTTAAAAWGQAQISWYGWKLRGRSRLALLCSVLPLLSRNCTCRSVWSFLAALSSFILLCICLALFEAIFTAQVKLSISLYKNKHYFDIRKEGWQGEKQYFPHGNEGWQFLQHSDLLFCSLKVWKWRGQERVCLFRHSFFDQRHSLWRMEYWIPFAVSLYLSTFESGSSLWTLWNMSIPPTSPLPFFPDIGIFKGHHTAWPEKWGVLKCPWHWLTYTRPCWEIGQKLGITLKLEGCILTPRSWVGDTGGGIHSHVWPRYKCRCNLPY